MLVVMAAASASYVANGWSVGDAVYMVVLTVYTVGFDEVRPINTPELREITIALIVFGCTGMLFLTGALVQLITLSELQTILGTRRMQGQIDRLRDHVIICGFGRIGVMLAEGLSAGGTRFVVVERDEERLEQARTLGYLCLQADATNEQTLREAGIERARCLATVLPNDAANVFITLSGRSLNADLTIIARGEAPSTERKLLQAGADRVVLPAHIGAERITDMILFPETDRLLNDPEHDIARSVRTLGLDMEVMVAAEGSRAVGQTLDALERHAAGTFMVVALNRRGGETLVSPARSLRVEAGDGIVLLGHPGWTDALTELFEPGRGERT